MGGGGRRKNSSEDFQSKETWTVVGSVTPSGPDDERGEVELQNISTWVSNTDVYCERKDERSTRTSQLFHHTHLAVGKGVLRNKSQAVLNLSARERNK